MKIKTTVCALAMSLSMNSAQASGSDGGALLIRVFFEILLQLATHQPFKEENKIQTPQKPKKSTHCKLKKVIQYKPGEIEHVFRKRNSKASSSYMKKLKKQHSGNRVQILGANSDSVEVGVLNCKYTLKSRSF